jgi:hypothetical protein
VVKKLQKTQASSIRIIAGAYKATPIRELETEIFTPPADIYCKERYAAHIQRTYNSPVGDYIKEQCQAICRRLRRGKRKPAITTTTSTSAAAPVIQAKLDWAEDRRAKLGEGKKATLKEWQDRWQASQGVSRWGSQADREGPSIHRLKLHTQLAKAESSTLIQARTGRTGLAHFLSKARVPGYESPMCNCGLDEETPQHVLLHCPLEEERRHWFPRATFQDLISTPENAAISAKWLIQSNRLPQFQLASRLLYGSRQTGEEERP